MSPHGGGGGHRQAETQSPRLPPPPPRLRSIPQALTFVKDIDELMFEAILDEETHSFVSVMEPMRYSIVPKSWARQFRGLTQINLGEVCAARAPRCSALATHPSPSRCPDEPRVGDRNGMGPGMGDRNGMGPGMGDWMGLVCVHGIHRGIEHISRVFTTHLYYHARTHARTHFIKM